MSRDETGSARTEWSNDDDQPCYSARPMPTPHILAKPGDFAEVVLMPGDPLRARHIATTFLTDARLVSEVRNTYGYTGLYRGHRVSVMAHGMGIPSCSIYATELITEFGAKILIRVGSCGAIARDVKLGDVIVAIGASTDSKVNRVRFMDHDFAAVADYELLAAAVGVAREQDIAVHVGTIFSSDFFYSPQPQMYDVMERMRILAVEMELAGLYAVAAEHGVRALGLLTVSDHIRRKEVLSSEERQLGLDRMNRIALETAARFAG
jgi:purine-nucleoside phosphorylase